MGDMCRVSLIRRSEFIVNASAILALSMSTLKHPKSPLRMQAFETLPTNLQNGLLIGQSSVPVMSRIVFAI
jgi:hypothetical protein